MSIRWRPCPACGPQWGPVTSRASSSLLGHRALRCLLPDLSQDPLARPGCTAPPRAPQASTGHPGPRPGVPVPGLGLHGPASLWNISLLFWCVSRTRTSPPRGPSAGILARSRHSARGNPLPAGASELEETGLPEDAGGRCARPATGGRGRPRRVSVQGGQSQPESLFSVILCLFLISPTIVKSV